MICVRGTTPEKLKAVPNFSLIGQVLLILMPVSAGSAPALDDKATYAVGREAEAL